MRSSAIFLVSVVTRHAVALGDPVVDLLDQVVDLALGRLDDDLGIHQPGGPDDLLDDLGGVLAARTRPAWPTGRRTG